MTLSSTATEITTGITNLDVAVDIVFMCRYSDNNWFKYWNPKELFFKKSNNKIAISTTSQATFPESYAIIEYTKTTDV